MTALINMPRAAWKRQPQGMADVNWNNSLTRGLLLCALPFQNNAVDHSIPNIPSGGIGFVSTSLGIEANSQNNTGVMFALNKPKAMLWYGSVFNSNERYIGIFAKTNRLGFYFYVDGTNQVQFVIVSTGWDTKNTGVFIENNKPALLISSSSSNSNHKVFINGKFIASYSNNIDLSVMDIGGAYYKDSYYYDGKIYGGALYSVWNRSLDDFEIKFLYENPWQLFESRPSRFILIPSSDASSVYQDGLIRWHILAAIQQDATLRWDVRITAQNDVLTRWNVLEGVLADTVLRWNSLAEIQQDSALRWDIASALSSVQQDAVLRWNLLTIAQQDVITRWNLLAAIQSDVVSRWNLLTSAQQDTIIRWNTLTTAEQDALLRWNALQSLESNQTLRWDVLSEVLSAQNDATLRWNTLSTIQQDALLRWNLAIAVEQSLATRWNLLNAVEISHAVRWNIAVEVANAIVLRWDSVESLLVSNDLNLTWNLIAVAENDIELRWNLGDSSVTPDSRIFLVRGEDRTFHLAVSDRIFGVQ